MSFNTALSGLQAATVDLSVTSNNIANVSTTGFKHSRAEFGDIFAVSPFASSPSTVGSGAKVQNVSQQFDQGNLEFTDASLDMALSGQGFFVVDDQTSGGNLSYTRAGQFGVNADGYITDSNGRFLQTFPVDDQGNVTSTSLSSTAAVLIPESTGAPEASTEVEIGVNLDVTTPVLDPANFDPTASDTFSHATSTTVYDSLGASHTMEYYFVHDNAPGGTPTNPAPSNDNQWAVFTYLDGNPQDVTGGTSVGAGSPLAGELNFGADGAFISSFPATGLTNTSIVLGMVLVH